MADFIAFKTVKGKVLKQRFTDHQWDLLGVNKNGWEKQNADQVVTATVKPSTGQRIQNVTSQNEQKDQVIDDVNKKKDQVIDQKTNKKEEEFLKHIEGFNKGIIKDFFDKENEDNAENTEFVKIEYSNKASLPDLKKQLAEYLKHDIKLLQEKFEA
jgi:hypothetical protein